LNATAAEVAAERRVAIERFEGGGNREGPEGQFAPKTAQTHGFWRKHHPVVGFRDSLIGPKSSPLRGVVAILRGQLVDRLGQAWSVAHLAP
jgi:hypothetical protein